MIAPYSGTLAWKIPWTEEPGRLQSMGLLRVGQDWATSLSLFTFMHWRRKWQSTPVFLPGESQGQGSLVGCRLWGCTESDTTEATSQQQRWYNVENIFTWKGLLLNKWKWYYVNCVSLLEWQLIWNAQIPKAIWNLFAYITVCVCVCVCVCVYKQIEQFLNKLNQGEIVYSTWVTYCKQIHFPPPSPGVSHNMFYSA